MKTNKILFADLRELIKELNKIGTENMNFEEFKSLQDYCINNKDLIIELINKLTINDIKKMIVLGYETKKEQMVKKFYDTVINYFNLGGLVSYSPFDGETYEGALMKVLNSQTEQTYLNYCKKIKEEKEKKEKAFNNPETLAEFRTFITYKGIDKLTPAQRETYDALITDTKKEIKQREEVRKNEVEKVEGLDGVKMEIIENHHAKKNIKIWVVKLGERVEREKYEELNNRAKKLGGYYSSYNKQGAIPGFIFEEEKAANMFVNIKEENVNTTELKEEIKEQKQQTKSEILIEKANKIIQDANEELNRERKDNTHRRATMAANIEERAIKNIEFGKTLLKIAEGVQNNSIKYLDKLSTATELEALNYILALGKNTHIREENLRSDEYEINFNTVNFCKIPYPILYKDNVLSLLNKLKNDPGKKLAAARLLKWVERCKDFIEVKGAQMIEDYKTVFCQMSGSISTWEVKSYKERLLFYERVHRLGIETPEELRTFLRELLNLKNGSKITEEQKREKDLKDLERTFIGKKIDGFFPTPEKLASKMLFKLGVKDNDTILEPSAGLGHIAEIIKETYPENYLKVCEINNSLCEALIKKGFEVENTDFLNFTGEMFDKIIMNPPFENLQDIDHLKHAYTLLKDGGRIVCIMAANKNNSQKKVEEFRAWLDEVGGYIEENEEGAFLSSFRPTSVNTITVIINK